MINLYQQPPVVDGQPNMGLHRVCKELHPFLAERYTFVNDYHEADIILSHAGSFQVEAEHPLNPHQGFISIVHGFHPTNDYPMSAGLHKENAAIIRNCVIADAVIVPSRWVGLPLERELFLKPTVIQWGVNWDEWQHEELPQDYVLWNKNRVSEVCNPAFVIALAKRLPQQPFVTTFGEASPNVRVLSVEWDMTKSYARMKQVVQQAGVYLATTKETGDIGSREALAAGVPVVAFAQGAVLDFLQHGVNGYLCEPNNIEALAEGVRYCQHHRAVLSANARELAREYKWEYAARDFINVIEGVYAQKQAERDKPLISVIVPCRNYEAYVGHAIDSVLTQDTKYPFELIVLDDASTDGSFKSIVEHTHGHTNVQLYQHTTNQHVANTRNHGLSVAQGQFVLALDADDILAPNALQTLASALLANPYLGIAFGRLEIMNEAGECYPTDWLTRPFDYQGQVDGTFNQVPTCCLFRREDALRVGGYRKYMQPSEDADLWARLVAFTGKTARRVTDSPTFFYRQHAGSLSRTLRKNPYAERGAPTWAVRLRPLASPPPHVTDFSNPVRAYDNPVVRVVIEGELTQASWDSLFNQAFWQWTLEDTPPTPFVLQWEGDVAYRANHIETLYHEGKLEANMACCGNIRQRKGTPLNTQDFVLVEWKQDMHGSPVHSFTNQRDEAGNVIRYTSDFLAGITRSMVHKADLAAKGYESRADSLWRVLPPAPPEPLFTPAPLPPPAPELLPSLVEDAPALVEVDTPLIDTLPLGEPVEVTPAPKSTQKRKR